MGRLAFFGIVLIVAGIAWTLKQAAGAISDDPNLKKTTFKGQTRKSMDSAARGLNWLNEQWEQAKNDAAKKK